MRVLVLALALLALPLQAEEAPLRPSASLLFKYPELLRPGSCTVYREGGAGWIMVEPMYYLRGTVVSSEVTTRQLQQCPAVPGKTREQYTRQEYVRLVQATPCLAAGEAGREVQLGIVRLRVDDWETPHVRKAENTGRLYRGLFLDRPLQKGVEIELEADLLGPCEP